MRLTRHNAAKEQLLKGQAERRIFDEDMPGFGVRIRENKRTWIVQYRLGTKTTTMTLGAIGSVAIEQARKNAKAALAKVALGQDPQAAKRQAREDARTATSFGEVVETYLAAIKPLDGQEPRLPRVRPRTFLEISYSLRNHWNGLNRLRLNSVDRQVVTATLARITNDRGPIAANRARSYLSRLYSWAMARGIAISNPVVGSERHEEVSRDRVLSDVEAAEIWRACNDDEFGRIVRLLLLTGQRAGEVAGISAPEIRVHDRLWSIPANRTKNKRLHHVPLSDEALAILQPALAEAGDRPYAFGRGEGPFSGWSKAKKSLDERVGANRAKHTAKPVPVAPWTIHDLRRSAATGMVKLGIQPHVVEAVLNHVSGHRGGVAGIYNRADYANEKRQALDMWGAHVAALVSSQPGNVVSMQERKAHTT